MGCDLPAVIKAVANMRINFMRPLVTGIMINETTAPLRMPKPIGKLRSPISIRSLPTAVS